MPRATRRPAVMQPDWPRRTALKRLEPAAICAKAYAYRRPGPVELHRSRRDRPFDAQEGAPLIFPFLPIVILLYLADQSAESGTRGSAVVAGNGSPCSSDSAVRLS